MNHRSCARIKELVAVLLILVAVLSLGCIQNLLVLQIGSPGVLVPVSKGDVFVLSYLQSMYQALVSEKFRIEDRCFRLVHVMTQSDAALEYLGLESKNEPNVDREFKEFTIPAASIGNHALRVHDRDISLGTHEDREGKIHVKLLSVSVLAYIGSLFWR